MQKCNEATKTFISSSFRSFPILCCPAVGFLLSSRTCHVQLIAQQAFEPESAVSVVNEQDLSPPAVKARLAFEVFFRNRCSCAARSLTCEVKIAPHLRSFLSFSLCSSSFHTWLPVRASCSQLSLLFLDWIVQNRKIKTLFPS